MPGDQDYDRDVVILSTLRIDGIHLINDAREAISLAGATLFSLEEKLAAHGREPHSVIGSSSPASVMALRFEETIPS